MPDNIIDTTLTWINQAREREGLELLSIDPKLNRVAEKHSKQMLKHNMLSDNDPALGTPFERIESSGLTYINNLVAVARAKNRDLLREQLKSPGNKPKILAPDITHAGIGIEQDSTGNLWLTIHMTERAITFTQFTLSQSTDIPARRSITIKGNTPFKNIKATLVPAENTNPILAGDRIIVPDSSGDFEITFTLGTATGNFGFEFYVQKNGIYELKNFFSLDI
ncbi:CAP domain-containing protein [Thermodesulfobacteriota bacterium]